MEFYDKFVDRFQDFSKVKNPTFSIANYLQPSKENVLEEYHTVTLTMLYFKVLHDMVSQST